MIFRKYSNPWFLKDGENFVAFFVIRSSDHGHFTQSFGDSGMYIIGIAVPQIVLHMRMLLLERGDPLGKEPGTTALHGSDIKCALQPLLHFANFFRRAADQIKNLIGILKKQFAFFCKGDLMGASHKQLCIKLLFQILNLTT